MYGLNGIYSRGISSKNVTQLDKPAPETLWKWSREADYYDSQGSSVQCLLCPNMCVISDENRGVCRVRVNKKGVLHTIAYGNPCSVNIDPIEKKPLYHFLPSSTSFSIATGGCNFRCLNCQNWSISQFSPEDLNNYDLMPEKVVQAAYNNKCSSIAYTYSEPSVFYEYMIDTQRIAVKQGIKGVWVTNGYLNEAPLEQLCEFIHGANIDLKAFNEDVYRKLTSGTLEPVLRTLKHLKSNNVWFEVTNLIVPSWSDSLDMITEMCKWLYENIGPDYPIHFSRFKPAYKLKNIHSTPINTLEKAWKIAKDNGLHHVYIGNVPGSDKQNTYCPDCSRPVIVRKGYLISEIHISNGFCDSCGGKIAGVWV